MQVEKVETEQVRVVLESVLDEFVEVIDALLSQKRSKQQQAALRMLANELCRALDITPLEQPAPKAAKRKEAVPE